MRKHERPISEMEFYRNAVKMRKEYTGLMLREFSIKYRVKDPDEQQGRKEKIMEGMIQDLQKKTTMDLHDLLKHILTMNGIKPINVTMLNWKLHHLDEAIGICESLSTDLIYIMECFKSKNLQMYADMADAEKAMLIGVKESAMRSYKRRTKTLKQNLCTAVTHSTSFANANGNGDANNNSASSAGGVRPDSMRAG